MITNANLCRATLGLAAAETLFWLYTFSYINRHANPMGDGMEWLAAVPMTIIFLALVLPTLILGVIGWWYALAAQIAAGLAALAALADVIVWTQIHGELTHRTVH
jgi:hypothetical protein